MANNGCEQVAPKSDWLAHRTSGKSEYEQKIWTSAYDSIHSANHYQLGEGPAPALTRLKSQGILNDVSITDIPKEARKLELEQGKDGQRKLVFKVNESVLPPEREHREIASFVDRQIKFEQANRLTPSVEKFQAALTPERTAQMKTAGLETDPQALHDKMVKRLTDDKQLNSTSMQHMKTFPVGAPYVATGAVTNAQMDSLLKEQKALRVTKQEDESLKTLKVCNPDEYDKQWKQYLRDTDLGKLLRVHAKADPQHYKMEKIVAADALIGTLKQMERQKT